MNRKDLVGLRDLTREEITSILDTAVQMRKVSERRVKKVPVLRGQLVVNLFLEPSTRTKVSFNLAAKRLSADTEAISAGTSSVTKGESLLDTVRNLEAMKPNVLVIRHKMAGAPHMLAKRVPFSVINAGDGINEHPTQGLLDMLTMRDHFGSLEGLNVAIVGDVHHSRVARSNIYGLTRMGARVMLAGPGTLCRPEMKALGVEVMHRVDDVLDEADVVMMLRVQRERLGLAMLPSIDEYAALYGLNLDRVQRTRPEVRFMHPGPINRGVEMTSEVADHPRSVVLEQVTNGVAVRMALLYLLLGGEREEEDNAVR